MNDRQYSAKTWLSEAWRIKKTELQIREEHAEKLKPDDGAMQYDKDRVQNDSSTLQEERLLSWTMAMQEVDNIKTKIVKIQRTRLAAINLLQDSDERSLLIARYLQFNEWKSICRKLGYSRTELHRRHMKALDNIFPLIKEVDDE